jgi:two-component system sensor histidine kinase KdpD
MTTGAAEQPASAWQVLFCGLVRHAAQATTADQGRAALLAAVSHDLRAPLAAAQEAVSGLRSRDVRLTADDRAELLDAAEKSLDLLGRLTASLLRWARPPGQTAGACQRPGQPVTSR